MECYLAGTGAYSTLGGKNCGTRHTSGAGYDEGVSPVGFGAEVGTSTDVAAYVIIIDEEVVDGGIVDGSRAESNVN